MGFALGDKLENHSSLLFKGEVWKMPKYVPHTFFPSDFLFLILLLKIDLKIILIFKSL